MSEEKPPKPKMKRNIIFISMAIALAIFIWLVLSHRALLFPAPEFRVSEPCLKAINIENKTLWNLIVRNKGKAGGTARMCAGSAMMLLEATAKIPTNELCLEKPVGAGDGVLFTFEVSPDQSIVDDLRRGQIDIDISCQQEILYLFRIPCKGIGYSCIYRKGNVSFEVEKAVYR